MLIRLIITCSHKLPMDWLSHLLEIMPVSGRLELRCLYGAPWRIAYERSNTGEIPYHVVLGGTAILEAPAGGSPQHLAAGDIVVLPHGSEHVLHDGSDAPPAQVQVRKALSLTINENTGTGTRLDMLCGRFILSPPHDRLMRDYLPSVLVVHATAHSGASEWQAAPARLAALVALMRAESAGEGLGGRAMLNALSTALFALTLRAASEAEVAPAGLLALAGHPRLAPALIAMLREPARSWTLPELAARCNMSRATLVRHFQEKVGRSASDLLTDIRMSLAANELKKASASTETVAEAVGYQSVAAFRRAFSQHTGMTPAEWRHTLHLTE
jgi:AraC family transcriptional activator of mtrCDE